MKNSYRNYILLGQEALLRKEGKKAQKAYERALSFAKKKEEKLHCLYTLADLYWAEDQKEEAKDLFRQILEEDPKEAGACYGLAILSREERPQKAIYWFEKAILRNPNYSQAYYYQAHVWNDLCQKDKAEELFLQAIAIDPLDPLALNDLGSLYEEEGKNKKAKAYFSRAIKVHPSFARGLYNMGVIEYKLGHPEDALAYYRRALEEAPFEGTIYLNMSAIYLETGRPEEALRILDEGLDLLESHLNLFYNRACAKVRLGDLEGARRDLEAAGQIDADALFWARDDEDLKDLVLERNEEWL
ncbi:MAG: tetratricopeptide repeat protein [Tissierellia bacterium]|nr:tetratricopeptide repeat protein [Tissierellia bacterium]